MAIFRKIHTQIWSDPFFSELDNEKKIFYLYLLTNERTRQCGIYEISKRHMAFDLGMSLEKVTKYILHFSKCGKIQFSDSTNEIAVKNWAKYNYSTSPKVVKCIESELCNVKNRLLIEYIYSMDSVSQEEEEKEEEKEPINKIELHPLVEYLNTNCPKVQKLEQPINNEQATNLLLEFDKHDLVDVFMSMQNTKDLNTKYTSANLTVRSWIKRRQKDNSTFGQIKQPNKFKASWQ
jgi:hypothetical protein